MSKGANRHPVRIDQLFTGPGARADQWRNLVELAEAWSSGSGNRAKFEAALAEMTATEEFHAYPGLQLMTSLRDHAAENDAQATASLARRITRALLTRSFRQNPGDWEADEDSESVTTDALPPALGRSDARRPYFEVLIVTGAPATRWRALGVEWRRLRRPLDAFVYEPVFVAQFHEAVFTHASTSPNQQLIASLDVARRQMELEGYGLVHNAIEVALAIRQAVADHPLISEYFHILGADKMVPMEYRQSGFTDYLDPKTNWAVARRSLREDEFCLDPTRMTLVCGTAGFDGTQFKGILASRYNIQLNKTSRNSVLLQSNINNTRSDIAHLIRVLVEISSEIDKRLAQGGSNVRQTFDARVKSLMTDVPDLPNFSHFHDAFRKDAGKRTNEGDIRGGFYTASDAAGCEYIRLADPMIDRRLKDGPDLVSANFVIPHPPGFPIMVPGQVITQETIDFMRKLDVKEIHGYDATEGLKLVRADALAKRADAAPKRAA